jgi:hypothetical protein
MPLVTGFIPPCIPTRAYRVPSGPGWLHEVKHDGYRLQIRRGGDKVRLFTRRGYDWRYPAIVRTATGGGGRAACVYDGKGRNGHALLLRRAVSGIDEGVSYTSCRTTTRMPSNCSHVTGRACPCKRSCQP